MKNTDIEKFHKAWKVLIELGNEEDYKDAIVPCSVTTSWGVQIYRGIEELAKYLGAELTEEKEKYTFVYDGIKYFQLIENTTSDIADIESGK